MDKKLKNVNNNSLKDIRRNSILFGLECVKTRIGHLGTGKEKVLFEIRDSLIYRSWAVMWHINYMENLHKAIVEKHSNMFDITDSKMILRNDREQLHYIFDDIIFNLSSMFDYIGNLVGITYRGQLKSRTKWNGVIKSARDKNNPVYSSPVKDLLIKANKEWVNHLFNYRGDNIHHKIELGDAKQSVKFSEGIKIDVNFYIPNSLSKHLLGKNTKDICILEGANIIAERSAEYCNEILNCMTSTLEPDYW